MGGLAAYLNPSDNAVQVSGYSLPVPDVSLIVGMYPWHMSAWGSALACWRLLEVIYRTVCKCLRTELNSFGTLDLNAVSHGAGEQYR